MSRLFYKKERHEEVAGDPAASVGTVEEEVAINDEPAGAVEVLEEEQPKGCRTLAHIGTYPLVQQTKHVLERLPPARILAANTKPTVVSVIRSKPVTLVRPLTNVADILCDKTLTVTEKLVPSLKTKTYQRLGEEIKFPYTFTKTLMVKTTHGTLNIAHDFLYEPTHESIVKFRKYYNEKVIDTHGKPIIRGSFDFAVRPANKQYEKLITKVLPEGKEVPANGFSNELDRTVALSVNMVRRAVPAAAKKTSRVFWSPCGYVKHVNDVFNTNLDKQENLMWCNSWAAAKTTVCELNMETLNRLKQRIPGAGRRNAANIEVQVEINDPVPSAQQTQQEHAQQEAQQEQQEAQGEQWESQYEQHASQQQQPVVEAGVAA